MGDYRRGRATDQIKQKVKRGNHQQTPDASNPEHDLGKFHVCLPWTKFWKFYRRSGGRETTHIRGRRSQRRKRRLAKSVYLDFAPARAEMRPMAMSTPPEILRCALRRRTLPRSREAMVPARRAQPESLNQPISAKRTPNSKIWTVAWPRVGSTNCGRKARKKRAVFGFSRFTRTPWPKMRRSFVSPVTASSRLTSPLRKVRTPR